MAKRMKEFCVLDYRKQQTELIVTDFAKSLHGKNRLFHLPTCACRSSGRDEDYGKKECLMSAEKVRMRWVSITPVAIVASLVAVSALNLNRPRSPSSPRFSPPCVRAPSF
jgi:hypothetical protein